MHGAKTAALLVALVAALAAAPSANAQTTISAGAGRGSYNASTDVTTELGLSTGVAEVKTALAVDAPRWIDVKTKYDSKVKSVADENRTGDPVFDAFKAEYGSATFITDYFYEVVLGENGFATTTAERKEMAEKTALDMTTMIAVLGKLYAATQDGTEATRWANWDQAAAYYIGSDVTATTYGRADKRGANYGKLGATGESAVNTAIISALNTGKAGTQAAMDSQYAIIVKQYKVLYAQATLRYANLIDKNLATSDAASLAENIAEGQAFYRLVKPWIKIADGPGAAVLTDMFDTAKSYSNAANHYNYCAAKAIVLAALAVTESELGALDAAAGVTCAASLPTGLPYIVTAAGKYTPAGPVGASLAFSDAVKTVVGQISDGPNNGAVVAAAYADSGLKGIADMNRAGDGTTDWDKFSKYFGSNTWISDLVTKATATTTVIKSAGARAEIIEKSIMDNIAMQAMLYDLHMATKPVSGSHTAASQRACWDNGAAKFMGSTAGALYTIYARANKRGANYGTLDTDGVTAKANKAIVQLLVAGATGDDTTRTAKLANVRNQLKVVYTQAALRYAWLVDRDLAEGNAYEEHQAEGMAFYNNIAPYVKIADPTGHAIVEAFFDVQSTPDTYNYYAFCAARGVMTKFLGSLAATDLGVLEGTSTISCTSPLPTGLPNITSKAGDYTPAGEVGASLSFSLAAKEVTSLVGDATDYAAVKAAFKAQGLAGAADRARSGEAVYDVFRAYFGKNAWMSEYLYAATDGTSLSSSSAARAEIIEKTARDAVAVNAILSDLYKGTQGVASYPAAVARRYWDAGAAKYLGADAARTSTVYNRADKRAANYGTLDGETAKANKAIIAALTAGAASSSTSTKVAEYHKIVTQMKVIYAQCALRYAFLIDADVIQGTSHVEHQAEGQAFWRVIAPWVKEVDANGAAYLEGIFDLGRTPAHANHFCHAKLVLAKLSINAADMGTLENTKAINCDGHFVPTNAADYFAKNAAAATAVSSGAAAPTVFAALASVAFVLVFA